MATIKEIKEINHYTDENGNTTSTIKECTTKIDKSNEPDYIKIYTNMWCEFNQIPVTWRPLFLELAARMSYCNANDLEGSQIVQTGSIFGENIQKKLGIGQRQYQKGLKALVDCNAIRRIGNHRGVYQINPHYAGRGEWKYNPKLSRGGVEDLRVTFDFKRRKVDLDVVWGDDGSDNEMNREYRKILDTDKKDNTTLKSLTIKELVEEDDRKEDVKDIDMSLDFFKKLSGI